MPQIPQHIIDQVLQNTEIVDIISETVALKKTGANYKACCPFHQEKTPSFVVSPDKQIFHCFGCGVGGNAVSFLMQYEKLEFPEALEKLAKRLGIALKSEKTSVKEDGKSRFYKINAYAQWFFAEQFEHAQKAKDYVAQRGLSAETVKTFELGYGPDSFEKLLPFLREKKVPLDDAAKLGIIKKRDSGGFYDFYRDRLLFPIRNSAGHMIGFSGRALGQNQEAKYINSPESPIYNKSTELYGFYQAKKHIIAKEQAVIVEGNIDVLACHQLGITHAVAPLGTSLTEQQVQKLKRLTTDIVLMFDGDDAGKKAALKAVQTCLTFGIHPKMIILPENQDPGDYLSQKNPKTPSLPEEIARANLAMDWIFAKSLGTASSQTSKKVSVIKELIQWLKKLSDPVEQMEYRKKLSQYFDISASDLQKMIANTSKTASSSPHQNSDTTDSKFLIEKPESLETLLVWLFLDDPSQFPNHSISGLSADFEDNSLKRLALSLEDLIKKDETFNRALAIQSLPKDLEGIYSRILLWDKVESNVGDCIKKFYSQRNKKRLKEITAQIVEAELKNDAPLKLKLLEKKQRLLSERNDRA